MSEGEGVKIDLSHAVNLIADKWFDLFTGDVSIKMPEMASAYPGSLSESDWEAIRSASTQTHYSLRWSMAQKATDSMWETRRIFSKIGWELKAGWIGIEYNHEGKLYRFIDQAHAYVELTEPSQSLTLQVKGMFSKPSFVNELATLPLYFNVVVKDGSTTIRDDSRAWMLWADGQKVRME